jgi:hypothetical protein
VALDDRAVLDRARDIIRERHMDTIAERRRPGRWVSTSPAERVALDRRYDAERWAVQQIERSATIADALTRRDPLVRETVLLALGDLS